jgi:hypothetical protein
MGRFIIHDTPMFPQRWHHNDRRSGFALLITITLLAFLVLLLVSLASLTGVETQVASNNQELSQARQNALMALNVALGKLQFAAGPDQRITATAELDSTSILTNRHWTGVWDSNPASATYRQRLTWLVSGTAPDAAVPVADPVTNPETSVRLVGENSADLSTPLLSDANRVDVPLEEIRSTAVPGLGTVSGGHLVGRFGYWIGDEGVKAKVTLTDPWVDATATEEQAYRLRLAQRAGIELVEFAPASPLGTNYSANDGRLEKVLGLRQLMLSNATGQAALTTAAKSRFHDLTASSYSVLTDVAKGGLKKDLTAWLAHSGSLASGAPADSDFMAPLASGDTTGFMMPRWGLLRSYDQLNRNSAVPATPVAQTDEAHGFHPVITYFRAAFGASCSGDNQPLAAHMFPVLKLWNPYSVRIPAGQYEFLFGTHFSVNNVSYRTSSGVKGVLHLAVTPTLTTVNSSSTGSQATRQYTRFRVNSPPMEPGECLVFTLASTGPYKDTSDPTAIQLVSIPGVFPATDNSVYWENPSITLTPTERAGTIRVDIPGGPCELALYPVPTTNVANPTVADWRLRDPYHLLQHFGVAPNMLGSLAIGQVHDDAVPGPYYWFGLPGVRDHASAGFRNPRLLANYNPEASLCLKVTESTSSFAQTYFGLTVSGSPGIDIFDTNKASAGYSSRNDSATNSPAIPLVITELPPFTTAPEARFLSLAQLQHVNFSKVLQSATYVVGNSEVNYMVGLTGTDSAIVPTSTDTPANRVTRIYDLSYLLNRELWDRFFFSTIPQGITDEQINDAAYNLPNGRHRFHRRNTAPLVATSATDTEAFNNAASLLLVNGGFNINSASVQAWRALLACHNGLAATAGSGFSRFSSTGAADLANTPRRSGYRILSQEQINRLAENIVAEVKLRGPFLSLGDFVNRRLATGATGYKGPLQAAIDATDLSTVASERINALPEFLDPLNQVGVQNYFPGGSATVDQKKLHLGSIDNPDVVRTRPSGSRAAFLPGFLSQADLLNSLGPVITARSDTFVIRAYGDVLNVGAGATTPEARAWCEAVVQRLPEYIENGVSASTIPAPGSDSATFGRRFKVISFRWLSAGDI